MYYTKATEPPMVKVFHYLIFFVLTLFGLIIACDYENINEIFINEESLSNFYSITIKQDYGNQSGIPMLQQEVEYESSISFSEMTRSEICDFQIMIKQTLNDFENLNDNLIYSYSNLQKLLEDSQYALDNGEYKYPYSQRDLDIVAYAIYREAGSEWLEDRHRDLVGCVVRNRKAQNGINQNLINPSYADIINEKGQYPYKSYNVNPDVIPDYCYESAIRVLEYKVDCPDSIIWQATFKQGSGVYEQYKDTTLGTTTYFCKK